MIPLETLCKELPGTVLGSGEAVNLFLTSLLVNGHALVTGPPGIGKTTRSMIGQNHAVSIRATLALQKATKASAFLDGRKSIHPDHVQKIFPHVLRHRLLTEETPDCNHLLKTALEQTPVA